MSALANILLKDGHIVEGVDVEQDFYTCKNLNYINIVSFDDFVIKDDFFYIIGNAFVEQSITKAIKESHLAYEYYPKFIDKYFKNLSMIAVSGSHGKSRL